MMLARNTIMRGLGVLVALLAVTVSTVFYAAEFKTFHHVKHVEYGATCKDCHEIDEATSKMKHKDTGCKDCHDKELGAVAPVGKSHQPDLRFSHKIHAAAFDCKDCHLETVSDKHEALKPLRSAEQCNSCHKESGIEINSNECRKCHASNPRKMAPRDHNKTWEKTHGRRSPWGSKVHDRTECSSCHTKTECVTCHRTTKPKSHTGLWRIRTHGTAASFDRDRCKTCHETGSCVFCHKRTAPTSHRGAWLATHGLTASTRGDERCRVCHSPAAFCTPCHAGGQ